MKIKKVIIEIKPLKKVLKEFAETYDKIEKGEKVTPKSSVVFSDVNTFRKILSDKRIELLSAIKHQNPHSTYELAKLLDREYKNVYEDVKLLEDLGLINREKNNLHVDYNQLNIQMML